MARTAGTPRPWPCGAWVERANGRGGPKEAKPERCSASTGPLVQLPSATQYEYSRIQARWAVTAQRVPGPGRGSCNASANGSPSIRRQSAARYRNQDAPGALSRWWAT